MMAGIKIFDSIVIEMAPKKFDLKILENSGFGIWKPHASSQNSEAVDVWKVARYPPTRRVVTCDDYLF